MKINHRVEVEYFESYEGFRDGKFIDELFKKCCIDLIKNLSIDELNLLFEKKISQSPQDRANGKKKMTVHLDDILFLDYKKLDWDNEL